MNALLAVEPRLKITPKRDDIVVCPLCYNKWFTKADIESGSLTAEHVPPHKLGGTVNALTCRECNSTHGAFLDSHLVNYVRSLDTLSGKGSSYIDGTISGHNTGEFRIEFRTTVDNAWHVVGVPKASNMEHIEAFDKGIQSKNFAFNLKLNLPSNQRAKVSLIKSAYLTAFQYLGYSFMVNHNLSVVRDQINQPQKDIYPLATVMFPINVPDLFLGINILDKPRKMKCYVVVFDVQAKGGLSRRAAVLLPGPDVKDYRMFKDLQRFSGKKMTVNHFKLTFEDKLETPHLALALWKHKQT